MRALPPAHTPAIAIVIMGEPSLTRRRLKREERPNVKLKETLLFRRAELLHGRAAAEAAPVDVHGHVEVAGAGGEGPKGAARVPEKDGVGVWARAGEAVHLGKVHVRHKPVACWAGASSGEWVAVSIVEN